MEKTKIGGIFTNSRLLKIPFFQRSYVWTADNWNRFLDDMEYVVQNDKDYFLGTYIMKQQPTPSNSKISDIRTVIDGQQRFTTILLFFLVLYQNNNNYEGFKRDFFNRTNNICLLHNHNDLEIFNAIMNNSLTQDLCTKYSGSKILEAYLYFQSKAKNFTEYDIDILLNRLYFVGIDVQQDENEQQIFDTINSLGVRLTTAELLKNYLFTSEDDIELYNSTWLECFEKDTETKNFWDANITSGSKVRSNIDILLYSYLNIKYDKEFTIETLFENFKIYLTSINYANHKEDVLEELTTYAKLYYNNIDYNCCNEPLKENKNSIERLNIIFFGLETTTLIPYCLAVLKNTDISQQTKIFGFLEKYVIRRMICNWSTKNYNKMFQSFIRNGIFTIDELEKEIYLTNKNDSRNSKMPTDLELRKELEVQAHTNKKAKGILYLLEVALREPDIHCTNVIGLSKYDLEHIMPQDWKTNWKLPINHTIEQLENRNLHVGLLGNKTILTSKLNKSIKNAAWNIKKYGDKNKGGFNDYAKGLKTFNFENIDVWNEESIDNRTNELYLNIIKVWQHDKESLNEQPKSENILQTQQKDSSNNELLKNIDKDDNITSCQYKNENINQQLDISNKQSDNNISTTTNSYTKGAYPGVFSNLSKAKIRNICNKNGFEIHDNFTKATKNSTQDNYWANPNISYLNINWHLVLNDSENKILYCFIIPAYSINIGQIKTRNDMPHLIDLQIRYNDTSFRDNRSGISFAKWLIKTIEY